MQPHAANHSSKGAPSPFLKWAGGKRQLLKEIVPRLPLEVSGAYFEPFLGGAAVFFELSRLGRIKRAHLSDRNEELVAAYVAVRDRVEEVIVSLGVHRNEESHYYEVRDQDPAALEPAQRAARMIFLNRVGYNGLYRVNASGKFNVPFGRHPNPTLCDADGLREASRALRCAEVRVAGFDEACAAAREGDVVYLDPPYLPSSATASFTAYASRGFGEDDHRALAKTFRRLVDRGAYVLLSNSDTPLARELYSGFQVAVVDATRAINSNAEKRGAVRELIIQGLRVQPDAPLLRHDAP